MAQTSVVVVGAGVFGSFTALGEHVAAAVLGTSEADSFFGLSRF